MPSTSASYRESFVSARIKTGDPQAVVCCAFPRTNTLRRVVIAWMVQVHQIAPELAAYHVSQMDFPELRRRMRHYLALEVGVGVDDVGPRARALSPRKLADARDGGPTNSAPTSDSSAFPLRGRRGWFEGSQDQSLGERAFAFEVFT
jgi:hypothetical protein